MVLLTNNFYYFPFPFLAEMFGIFRLHIYPNRFPHSTIVPFQKIIENNLLSPISFQQQELHLKSTYLW